MKDSTIGAGRLLVLLSACGRLPIEFDGAGPVRRALGMRRATTARAAASHGGQVGADAVVRSGAEGLYCRGALAGVIEAVRVVEYCGVAVGGSGVGDDEARAHRRGGIVKLSENACGAVDVNGPGGERYWLTVFFMPLRW